MKLPNSDRAVVEIDKLRNYCLNPNHLKGKHKARVFASALGITASDAEELQQILLRVVTTNDATPLEEDAYGKRYRLDFVMIRLKIYLSQKKLPRMRRRPQRLPPIGRPNLLQRR